VCRRVDNRRTNRRTGAQASRRKGLRYGASAQGEPPLTASSQKVSFSLGSPPSSACRSPSVISCVVSGRSVLNPGFIVWPVATHYLGSGATPQRGLFSERELSPAAARYPHPVEYNPSMRRMVLRTTRYESEYESLALLMPSEELVPGAGRTRPGSSRNSTHEAVGLGEIIKEVRSRGRHQQLHDPRERE
jgi:hypothetical protein